MRDVLTVAPNRSRFSLVVGWQTVTAKRSDMKIRHTGVFFGRASKSEENGKYCVCGAGWFFLAISSHSTSYMLFRVCGTKTWETHECVLFSFRCGGLGHGLARQKQKVCTTTSECGVRRDESIKLYCFMMFTIISRCLVSIFPGLRLVGGIF